MVTGQSYSLLVIMKVCVLSLHSLIVAGMGAVNHDHQLCTIGALGC